MEWGLVLMSLLEQMEKSENLFVDQIFFAL